MEIARTETAGNVVRAVLVLDKEEVDSILASGKDNLVVTLFISLDNRAALPPLRFQAPLPAVLAPAAT